MVFEFAPLSINLDGGKEERGVEFFVCLFVVLFGFLFCFVFVVFVREQMVL